VTTYQGAGQPGGAPPPPSAGPAVLLPGPPGTHREDPPSQPPRTGQQLHVAVHRLRRLLTGGEPVGLTTGLVPVEVGRDLLAGTSLPALQTLWVPRRNGLLVPLSAAPQPLDLASAYITGEELFGVAPPPGVTVCELERMPFEAVLAFVAATLVDHRRPGVPTGQSDREFAERWLTGPARARALNLLHDPVRRLIVPQGLYALIKFAAWHSPDAVLPGTDPPHPVIPLFGALGAVDDEHDDPDASDQVIHTDVGPFTGQVLANQHLNKPLDEDHLMARFVRQWLELPAERAGEDRVLDLEAAFAEVTGVPLRDVVVVAVALWARSAIGEPHVPVEYLAVPGWSSDRLAAALRLLTTDSVTLRGLLRTETREHELAWTFSALERYPVVRLDDGALLVLDRNLLVRRVLWGL
jgi:hypothetical protein